LVQGKKFCPKFQKQSNFLPTLNEYKQNRLGGGCPSGQGLTGFARMSVTGCVSCAFMFVGAIVTGLVYHI
jgi:hypothetical protein